MDDGDVYKKLDAVENLPTLPVILDKLRELIDDPDVDAKQIAQLMENDPSMMTNVLKLANSPLYGATQPVTSLQLAVARLGLTTVNNLALSTAIFKVIDDKNTLFNRTEFWRHCICVGITMNILHERSQFEAKSKTSKDTIQLCGLLHDIGRIVFEKFFHNELEQAIDISERYNEPLFKAEKKILGVDHAEVGAWLAQKWSLPEIFYHVILHHHNPLAADEDWRDIVGLVHIADYICTFEKIGDSGNRADSEYFQDVWESLGLSIQDLPDIVKEVHERSQHSQILLAMV